MAKKAQSSLQRPWLVPVLIGGIVIVAALIAFFYGDQIATFVRYRGTQLPGSASVLAIACIDEDEDGSCDGNTGRVADVQLELTETNGTVTSSATDANGTARFEPVSFGNHEMLVTLPFPGSLTVDNPIPVNIPAPVGGSSSFEVVVFVPISLTGEAQFSVDMWYQDQTVPGALLDNTPATDETTYAFYPQQTIGTRFAIHSNLPIDSRTSFEVIADFDDACTEIVDDVHPASGKATDSNVVWNLDKVLPGKFDRTFKYQMRIDSALPEIDPLICTDRVTVLNATGDTVATKQLSYQVLPTPSKPVLQMTKTVTDQDGGAIKPGDTLTYTIGITNIGGVAESAATLVDELPALVEDATLIVAPDPTKVTITKTGGKNGAGQVTITDLNVPVTRQTGEQVTVSFSVKVLATKVKQFALVDNYVTLKGDSGAYAEALRVLKIGQVPTLIRAN